MAFSGVDFLGLDELLTEEDAWCATPSAALSTTRSCRSSAVTSATAASIRPGPSASGPWGALGASLQGYGCAGLGPIAYGLIMQELERGDSGVRSFASVQGRW